MYIKHDIVMKIAGQLRGDNTTAKKECLVTDEQSLSIVAKCDEIINNYLTCPPIEVIDDGTITPHYSPLDDSVTIPTMNQFETKMHFYKTLFHELAHSTMDEKRLDRDRNPLSLQSRSKEEALADFTSMVLLTAAAEPVLDEKSLDNLIATHLTDTFEYIKSWSEDADINETIDACTFQAMRIVNYITGNCED